LFFYIFVAHIYVDAFYKDKFMVIRTVFCILGKFIPRGIFNTNTATIEFVYEGWNFNSGNYLFTTDTK